MYNGKATKHLTFAVFWAQGAVSMAASSASILSNMELTGSTFFSDDNDTVGKDDNVDSFVSFLWHSESGSPGDGSVGNRGTD